MTSATLTPDGLLQLLEETDRIVEPRTLRSWHSEKLGLLPPLTQRGRGRGRGSEWFWHEPDVFERACIVYDALERLRRSYYAKWCLWWCGFDVPPSEVREIWLQALEKQRLVREAQPGEFPSEKYDDEIERLNRSLQKAQGLEEFLARGIARSIITAIQEPVGRPLNKDEFAEFEQAAFQQIRSWTRSNEPQWGMADHWIRAWWPIFQSVMSIDARIRLVTAVTDDEFQTGRQYLRLLGRVLRSVSYVSDSKTVDAETLFELRFWFAPVFGPPIFRIVMQLIRTGNIGRLTEMAASLARISAVLDEIAAANDRRRSQIKASMHQKIRAEMQTIIDAWKGFDFQSLSVTARS